MRLLDVIQRSSTYLEEHGVENPRLQTELILAHVLRQPRLQLYLQFERTLDPATLDAAREAVRRRGRREPLQHILGTTSFCGLELEVSPVALIPRPETELVAERAWTWLHQRASSSPSPATTPLAALDWGTGTGCLALALAHHCPDLRVTAVDRSPDALDLARRNAARLGLVERVEFVESDGCTALAPERTWDLIVSNPPYIPSAEIATLEPEVRDHDPRLALDGGTDGLDVYRRLAVEVAHRLRPGGALVMEFGDGQAPALQSLLRDAGWIVDETRADYSGRDRFLLARRAP